MGKTERLSKGEIARLRRASEIAAYEQTTEGLAETDRHEFAIAVAKAIKAQNMTFRALAEKIDMDPSQLSRTLTGDVDWQVSFWSKIKCALGFSDHKLLPDTLHADKLIEASGGWDTKQAINLIEKMPSRTMGTTVWSRFGFSNFDRIAIFSRQIDEHKTQDFDGSNFISAYGNAQMELEND